MTHPGRQHSHQAALGLHRAGMLTAYWSGVPALESQARWLPRRAWARYQPVDLPAGLVRAAPWTPALRRLGDRVPSRTVARWIDFAACRLFDRWAARALAVSEADAVIACEISALRTFRRARSRGIATLLDAPSLHRAAQDRLHGTDDPPRLHRRIAAVKDAEIALADHVLTVSELARSTYVEAGTDPRRVHALPLGADLALFAPAAELPGAPERGCTFVFCGATIRRKGFDLLVEAFSRVRRRAPHAELRLLGPLTEDGRRLLQHAGDGVAALGPRPQAEIARELQRADCLVLPSRNDSYAMVVAEALASGTPALVSEMVGARDLIEEGRTGWVVPLEDVDALAERMAWCAAHREELARMRPACRAAALGATWPAYHRRLSDLVAQLLSGDPARRSPAPARSTATAVEAGR